MRLRYCVQKSFELKASEAVRLCRLVSNEASEEEDAGDDVDEELEGEELLVLDNVVEEVLEESVQAYTDVHSHRAIEMMPEKATLSANTNEVKPNLEGKRVSPRKYPKLMVGDNIRLYHKKHQLDKERITLWSCHIQGR